MTPTRRSDDRRPAHKGEVEAEFTLPRHLHRAVLRLLRPAEAAARRLIIAAARELAATPQARKEKGMPPPRLRKPSSIILRDGVGTGIVMPRHLRLQASASTTTPRALALPLFDPLRPWGGRPRPAAQGVPRISVPGYTVPFPVPAPPSPGDLVDARRLVLRLQAVGRALDDLPREARRFARWRARARQSHMADTLRDADAAGVQNRKTRGPIRRVWPLRPGRPPGWCRRPVHEVHEILNAAHGLAIWALQDTS